MNARRVYKRDEVYELVWSMPMRDAAKHYRISDVALKKVCRSLSVPTPDRGYWLRSPARRERLALPKLPPNKADTLVGEWMPDEAFEASAEATSAAHAEKTRVVIVEPELSAPHELVLRSAQLLSKATPRDAVISSCNAGGLDVTVAPASVTRALSIMDALLKAFDARIYPFEVTRPTESIVWGRPVISAPVTRVCVDDEWIMFDLVERVKVEPLPQTRQARTEKPHIPITIPRSRTPRRRRTPTGILVLTVRSGARPREWRDRKGRRLEEYLTEFLAHLPLVADWLRQEGLKAEEERRRREAAEQLRFEAEQRVAEAKQKVDHLYIALEQWRMVRDLRTFASEIRGLVQASSMKVTDGGPLHEYIAFVLAQAESLDPLHELRERMAQPTISVGSTTARRQGHS